jgi:hypothetical protein
MGWFFGWIAAPPAVLRELFDDDFSSLTCWVSFSTCLSSFLSLVL